MFYRYLIALFCTIFISSCTSINSINKNEFKSNTFSIKVTGASMLPTFSDKQILSINRGITDLKRGDIIIMNTSKVTNEMFIKRIVGLPGEIIKIIDGRVLMKHSQISDYVEFEEEYLSEYNKGKTFLPLNVKETEFLIPEGKYFVMGDNRINSSDSRSCFGSCTIEGSTHFLDQKDIVGKVIKF